MSGLNENTFYIFPYPISFQLCFKVGSYSRRKAKKKQKNLKCQKTKKETKMS